MTHSFNILFYFFCSNIKYIWDYGPASYQITEELQKQNILFSQRVDYDGIRRSAEFARYKELTRELIRVRIAEASRQKSTALTLLMNKSNDYASF